MLGPWLVGSLALPSKVLKDASCVRLVFGKEVFGKRSRVFVQPLPPLSAGHALLQSQVLISFIRSFLVGNQVAGAKSKQGKFSKTAHLCAISWGPHYPPPHSLPCPPPAGTHGLFRTIRPFVCKYRKSNGGWGGGRYQPPLKFAVNCRFWAPVKTC